MSIIGSNVLAGASGGAADTGYQIQRSLRFNSGDSPSLTKTFASAGNRKTFTFSCWLKVAVSGTQPYGCLLNQPSGDDFILYNRTNGKLEIYKGNNSVLTTNPVFRDPSAWQHFVFAVDTTQSTASNRFRIYHNGSEITSYSVDNRSSYIAQNSDFSINSANAHNIGGDTSHSHLFDGYIADVHFVDGQALAPTDFGEFDDNNVWQPKAFTGTYNASAQTWSNDLTSSGTFSSAATNAFDGDTSTLSQSGANAESLTFAPSGGIAYSTSVEVYVYQSDGQFTTTSDGAQTVSWTSTFQGWKTIASGGGTFTSTVLSSTSPGTSTSRPGIAAIRVDGSILLDTPAGVNGFHLDFSDASSNAALGYDAAGSNDWTVNNLSVASGAGNDSLVDTPTNYGDDTGAGGEVRGNYATLNPLKIFGTASMSNGNLDGTCSSSTQGLYGTIAMSSGKWYWEITNNSAGGMHGIANLAYANNNWFNGTGGYFYYYSDGSSYQSGNIAAAYGDSYTTGDVVGVAYDADNGNLYFYKNGTIQNSGTAAFTGLSGTFAPFFQDGSGSTHTFVVNFGQRPFAYTAPSGYKALCTTNLPEPTIADGSAYFDIAQWTGQGNTNDRTITTSFNPDLVWIKSRSDGTYNHALFDATRGFGTNNVLSSNTTGAEGATDQGYIKSTTSSSMTLGVSGGGNAYYNGNNFTYVSWYWDAGASSSKTYAVTVVSDGGNKYRFDGHGTSAVTLDLEEGSTYTFDQSDSSNAGHPLRFSTTSDGTHGGGSEYTTGVTTVGTPGSAGASTTIVVASGAPTLYYYCSVHSGMGGQANTNSTAGASNFDGSIQATVRANPTAGFSVVSYTGNSSSSATVGHGLGVTPGMIIVKSRDLSPTSWVVAHTSLNLSNQNLHLNDTSSAGTTGYGAIGSWNSTTFGFRTESGIGDVNGNTYNYVAYCFAPVDGYSSGFSYTGNGNADGSFVYLNFRPRLILLKCSSTTGNWTLLDTAREGYNVDNDPLYPNLTNAEGTTDLLDITSNGFKLRTTDASVNSSGATYVGFAWAENPFKTARAR